MFTHSLYACAGEMTISRQRLLAALLLHRRRRRRKQRQYWVHPVNAVRKQQGDYHQLFQQLQTHEERFIKVNPKCILCFSECQ